MPGGKNQKTESPAEEPAKHVLVRMPADLHEQIVKLAQSYRPPRSINYQIVDMLYEVAEWFEGIDLEVSRRSDRDLASFEATAKKMLASIRESRARKK